MKFLDKYISKENQEILLKRLKSLAWRVGGQVLAHSLDFIAVNAGLFNLPVGVVVVIGLVASEVTKYLNSKKITSSI